ncbi:DUF11 domain-containing protein [Porphyrobacter sp. HT-58-2]|uniref:DUF11 domain-containing protein n=1 Tax=Porphyrobacter sp. HT-58-2 TaxID=2023229 RepID=UPI00155873E6|nr:DUF11 domain-containing protein [Porphyrobacter sp. HT-58-2]
MAGANGTPAATTVTNTATVEYDVGGVRQNPQSASTSFVVARKVNLALVQAANTGTQVLPGQTGVAVAFELSNLSNAALGFELAASQVAGGAAARGGTDNFDLAGTLQVFVDANANGIFEAGIDTASFIPQLAADENVTVFVVGDVPASVFGGDIAAVELTAIAREASTSGLGAPVVETADNGSGMATVFADGAGTSDTARDARFSAREDFVVTAQPIDLEVDLQVSNTSPRAGFDEYTVTVTVANRGPGNASGVVLGVPLPGGSRRNSDTSNGAWDPEVGDWTVGAVPAGEQRTFSYTALAVQQGTFNADALVTAAEQTDADSSPVTGFGVDDLGDGIADDDEARVELTILRDAGTVAAQTCPTGTSALNWSTSTWTAASRSGTFNVAGKPITINVADPGNALISGSPLFTPNNAPFYRGGLPATQSALNFAARDVPLAGNDISITIELGPEGVGVENLRFMLFDLDGNPNFTRLEQATITGSFGGANVPVMLAGGSAISILDNSARGIVDSPNTGGSSGGGTLSVGFDGRVDRVTISWGNAPVSTSTTGEPGFALHNLVFCTPPTGIRATKTSTSFGPGDGFRIPGSEVIYTIEIANIGEVPIDADSIFLVDALPSELEFFNGDYDGSGPGSDPVGFEQSNAALSFDYNLDVGYSAASTQPTSLSACNYVPLAGHDPAVRYICVRPRGSLPATSPEATATIRFRTRIK